MQLNILQLYTIPEGDWEALYVNGVLKLEGHEVRFGELGKFVPIGSAELRYIENFDSDEDSFPKRVKNFPKHWIIK